MDHFNARQTRVRALLDACLETREMLPLAGETLCRHAMLEHRPAGSVLWTQGAPVTDVFVTSALIRICSQNEKGELASGAVLLTNSHLIGEAEVFAGFTHRFNEAATLIAQDVLKLPATSFMDCVRSAPELTYAWLQRANQRFLTMAQHAQMMRMRSAEERLRWAVALLIAFEQLNTDGTILLACSQEMIASAAALTRSAAARVLADWRQQGLIETRYESVRILQPQAFKA
ncbi:MAG: Crp/Fnr family transcriptional regulator [Chryseolinea sp.]